MTRLRDFINESPEYSLYDADRFQTHLDNVNAHKKEVEYSYEDDSLYDDRAGEK